MGSSGTTSRFRVSNNLTRAALPALPRHCKYRETCHGPPVKKQTRQILIGSIPIFAVTGVVITIFLLGRLPGFAGEVFRKIAGIMSTPFFLELSFAFLGLVAVFCVNNIRLQREGDEYVALEIEEDSDDPQS